VSKFRLATVERLRSQQEQICARRLQECTHSLAQAQQERARLVAELDATQEFSGSGEQLMLAAQFRERLREEILAASREIENASAKLNQARTSWLNARAQLAAVRSLHERHRMALRAGVARQEQADADEFAGSRGAVGGGVR
jgi:flagellar export protein FliJ